MTAAQRLAACVLAVATLAAGCSLPGQKTGDLTLKAAFDDVGDLVSGHSVQLADVRIGSVTGIELTDDFRAMVTMSVDDNGHLPANLVARVRTTSLLGEKFIELIIPEGTDVANLAASERIADGTLIEDTAEAPELEFVADQAVVLLGAVMGQDIATLVNEGSASFIGRRDDLTQIIDDLEIISDSLATHSADIVRIIDGLDGSLGTLAAGRGDIGTLLGNLAESTAVLADNRDRAIDLLGQLTRLAKVTNDEVLEPYASDLDRQIKQVDAILAEVVSASAEVANLVDFIALFTEKLPLGVPRDAAQVYAWFSIGSAGSPDPESGG